PPGNLVVGAAGEAAGARLRHKRPRADPGDGPAIPGQVRLVGVAGRGGERGQTRDVAGGPGELQEPLQAQDAAQRRRAVAEGGEAAPVQLTLPEPDRVRQGGDTRPDVAGE